MKYLFLIVSLIFSVEVFAAKVATLYSCPIDETLKIEISFIDKNHPSVDLFYKKSKFGNCIYNDTIYSRLRNPNAQVISDKLRLKRDVCRYYFEEHKSKIDLVDDVTFINTKGSSVSYLRIVEGLQPLKCVAKK